MLKLSNVKKFYIYTLFHSLVFAYVIERLFWASRGMRVMDVVYTEIIYSGVILLLELPTGMFADRFSRKRLIVLDSILSGVEFLIIIFATQFWHFALAIALSGVGHALQSGAHNALLYDSMKAEGNQNSFEKVLGRINAVDVTGSLAGALLGAVIATQYPMVTTYWLSLISLILALFLSLSIKEVKTEKSDSELWGLEDWAEIFRFIFKGKHMILIALVGMSTAAVTGYLEEFWQIYLDALEVDVVYFGIFQMLSFGAAALGGVMAYKYKEKLGLNKTLEISIGLAAIGFLCMALIKEWYIVPMAAVVTFGMAVVEPLIYGYLHDHATDKYRATMESAFSFIVMFAVILVGLPFGWLATQMGIFVGFLYLGGLVTLVLLVYAGFNRYLV